MITFSETFYETQQIDGEGWCRIMLDDDEVGSIQVLNDSSTIVHYKFPGMTSRVTWLYDELVTMEEVQEEVIQTYEEYCS